MSHQAKILQKLNWNKVEESGHCIVPMDPSVLAQLPIVCYDPQECLHTQHNHQSSASRKVDINGEKSNGRLSIHHPSSLSCDSRRQPQFSGRFHLNGCNHSQPTSKMEDSHSLQCNGSGFTAQVTLQILPSPAVCRSSHHKHIESIPSLQQQCSCTKTTYLSSEPTQQTSSTTYIRGYSSPPSQISFFHPNQQQLSIMPSRNTQYDNFAIPSYKSDYTSSQSLSAINTVGSNSYYNPHLHQIPLTRNEIQSSNNEYSKSYTTTDINIIPQYKPLLNLKEQDINKQVSYPFSYSSNSEVPLPISTSYFPPHREARTEETNAYSKSLGIPWQKSKESRASMNEYPLQENSKTESTVSFSEQKSYQNQLKYVLPPQVSSTSDKSPQRSNKEIIDQILLKAMGAFKRDDPQLNRGSRIPTLSDEKIVNEATIFTSFGTSASHYEQTHHQQTPKVVIDLTPSTTNNVNVRKFSESSFDKLLKPTIEKYLRPPAAGYSNHRNTREHSSKLHFETDNANDQLLQQQTHQQKLQQSYPSTYPSITTFTPYSIQRLSKFEDNEKQSYEQRSSSLTQYKTHILTEHQSSQLSPPTPPPSLQLTNELLLQPDSPISSVHSGVHSNPGTSTIRSNMEWYKLASQMPTTASAQSSKPQPETHQQIINLQETVSTSEKKEEQPSNAISTTAQLNEIIFKQNYLKVDEGKHHQAQPKIFLPVQEVSNTTTGQLNLQKGRQKEETNSPLPMHSSDSQRKSNRVLSVLRLTDILIPTYNDCDNSTSSTIQRDYYESKVADITKELNEMKSSLEEERKKRLVNVASQQQIEQLQHLLAISQGALTASNSRAEGMQKQLDAVHQDMMNISAMLRKEVKEGVNLSIKRNAIMNSDQQRQNNNQEQRHLCCSQTKDLSADLMLQGSDSRYELAKINQLLLEILSEKNNGKVVGDNKEKQECPPQQFENQEKDQRRGSRHSFTSSETKKDKQMKRQTEQYPSYKNKSMIKSKELNSKKKHLHYQQTSEEWQQKEEKIHHCCQTIEDQIEQQQPRSQSELLTTKKSNNKQSQSAREVNFMEPLGLKEKEINKGIMKPFIHKQNEDNLPQNEESQNKMKTEVVDRKQMSFDEFYLEYNSNAQILGIDLLKSIIETETEIDLLTQNHQSLIEQAKVKIIYEKKNEIKL